MPRKASKPKASRRGKNEGSIYKRNDGNGSGRLPLATIPTPESRFASISTPTRGRKRPARSP